MSDSARLLYRALRPDEIEQGVPIPKSEEPFAADPRLGVDTRLPFVLGPTEEHAVRQHQWQRKGWPTKGVSTTPHLGRARSYARHRVIAVIDRDVLPSLGIREIRVNEYLTEHPEDIACPDDEEVILLSEAPGPLPRQSIVGLLHIGGVMDYRQGILGADPEEVTMPETRRVLRHVTPGFLFALEALLLLFVWDGVRGRQLVDSLVTGGAGGGIAAVLASGAVGFFLATIHHLLSWHCRQYRGGSERSVAERRRAWIETLGGFCEKSKERREASESLTDTMHSLGTAFVGSALSLPAALLLSAWQQYPAWPWTTPATLGLAALVWGTLCCLHLASYVRARDLSRTFDEMTISPVPKQPAHDN